MSYFLEKEQPERYIEISPSFKTWKNNMVLSCYTKGCKTAQLKHSASDGIERCEFSVKMNDTCITFGNLKNEGARVNWS